MRNLRRKVCRASSLHRPLQKISRRSLSAEKVPGTNLSNLRETILEKRSPERSHVEGSSKLKENVETRTKLIIKKKTMNPKIVAILF